MLTQQDFCQTAAGKPEKRITSQGRARLDGEFNKVLELVKEGRLLTRGEPYFNAPISTPSAVFTPGAIGIAPFGPGLNERFKHSLRNETRNRLTEHSR